MRIRTSGTSSVHILLSHTHTSARRHSRPVRSSVQKNHRRRPIHVRLRTGTAEITDHWWQNAGGQWQARLLYKMTRRKDAREPLALGPHHVKTEKGAVRPSRCAMPGLPGFYKI